MTHNDRQLLIYDMKDRWETNKKELLAGIDTPYWDNEEYHWYVDQLNNCYMIEDDGDCIAIMVQIGYDLKTVLKTY